MTIDSIGKGTAATDVARASLGSTSMTKDSVQPLHHERIAISRGMVPDVTNGTYPGDLLMPALKRVRMLQRPAVVLIFGVTRVVAPESRAGDLRAVGHRKLLLANNGTAHCQRGRGDLQLTA